MFRQVVLATVSGCANRDQQNIIFIFRNNLFVRLHFEMDQSTYTGLKLVGTEILEAFYSVNNVDKTHTAFL